MLLSRLRHNEHIQIRRRLSRPRIFPACPPNFVRCEGRRSPAVEVTGDLSGWQQTGEITYFTTPTLDFSPPPPRPVSLRLARSRSHWISHFLCFFYLHATLHFEGESHKY